jgi:hypothetical protein
MHSAAGIIHRKDTTGKGWKRMRLVVCTLVPRPRGGRR